MTSPNEPTLFPLPQLARPEPKRRVRDDLTYSAASMFQTCRRRYRHRHVDHLVPLDRPHALRFGTVTHQWLEVWHRTRSLPDAQAIIDAAYVNRGGDRDEEKDWHHQTALLKAYAAQYATEAFEVVALEQEFAGPLVNPTTSTSPTSCSSRRTSAF